MPLLLADFILPEPANYFAHYSWHYQENESELKVLETETKEVSKDEMEMAIQRVA